MKRLVKATLLILAVLAILFLFTLGGPGVSQLFSAEPPKPRSIKLVPLMRPHHTDKNAHVLAVWDMANSRLVPRLERSAKVIHKDLTLIISPEEGREFLVSVWETGKESRSKQDYFVLEPGDDTIAARQLMEKIYNWVVSVMPAATPEPATTGAAARRSTGVQPPQKGWLRFFISYLNLLTSFYMV